MPRNWSDLFKVMCKNSKMLTWSSEKNSVSFTKVWTFAYIKITNILKDSIYYSNNPSSGPSLIIHILYFQHDSIIYPKVFADWLTKKSFRINAFKHFKHIFVQSGRFFPLLPHHATGTKTKFCSMHVHTIDKIMCSWTALRVYCNFNPFNT